MRLDVDDRGIEDESHLLQHLAAGRFLKDVRDGGIGVGLAAGKPEPTGAVLLGPAADGCQITFPAHHRDLDIHDESILVHGEPLARWFLFGRPANADLRNFYGTCRNKS